ncbi:decaprenyl-phosphate phosphoribosyltransferase [Chloroflexota bacterium]
MGKVKRAEPKVLTVIQPPAGWSAQLKYLFLAMRPRQWIKNLILFMALIFSLNQHWNFDNLGQVAYLIGITVAAFALFCLLSSAEYLFNDIVDINADRHHPKKKERPLASGKLNLTVTWVVAILLPLVALPLSYWLSSATSSGSGFGVVATLYFLLALSYSLFLKRQVIIDILAIAGGFVLRAVAGAVILSYPISPWLYICTMLLALLLVLGKRRQEFMLLEGNLGNYSKTLTEYSPKLLDEMLALVTAATVVSYSLYTFSAENLPQNHAMMLTIPFVLYGIFRYLYLIHNKGLGGSPEELLFKDKPLTATVFLWGLTVTFILFFSNYLA